MLNFEAKIETDLSGNSFTAIYKTDADGIVWAIPTDPANSDYQRYLRWLENPEAEETTTIKGEI